MTVDWLLDGWEGKIISILHVRMGRGLDACIGGYSREAIYYKVN